MWSIVPETAKPNDVNVVNVTASKDTVKGRVLDGQYKVVITEGEDGLAQHRVKSYCDAHGLKCQLENVLGWFGREIPGQGFAVSPFEWERQAFCTSVDKVFTAFTIEAVTWKKQWKDKVDVPPEKDVVEAQSYVITPAAPTGAPGNPERGLDFKVKDIAPGVKAVEVKTNKPNPKPTVEVIRERPPEEKRMSKKAKAEK